MWARMTERRVRPGRWHGSEHPVAAKRWSQLHDTGLKWTSADHLGHLADGRANRRLSEEHIESSRPGTGTAQ